MLSCRKQRWVCRTEQLLCTPPTNTVSHAYGLQDVQLPTQDMLYLLCTRQQLCVTIHNAALTSQIFRQQSTCTLDEGHRAIITSWTFQQHKKSVA